VQKIAHLARIELMDEEIEKFQKDLSGILDFVEQLGTLDIKDVQPMTGGTCERNVMRDDEEISDGLQGESVDLLDAVPENKGDWVKVKQVFEL
jgi:aspartyl-tRNA(Asn)/glutamyl-tRNA(Gln) amidotransferase subunit C